MSTNSTMINDRYCYNCGLLLHDCNSKTAFGYCLNWTPTKTAWDNIENFQLEENLPEADA